MRSTPIPKEEQLTAQEAEEGLLPKEPLLPGERVLLSGALELKALCSTSSRSTGETTNRKQGERVDQRNRLTGSSSEGPWFAS